MNISINNIKTINEGNQTAPQVREANDKPREESGETLSASKNEEQFVKAEILTKTDIEIRKLHALRRTKEYLEEKLASASAEASAIEPPMDTGSSSASERNYNMLAGTVSPLRENVADAEAHGDHEDKAVSFKTGAAISGYKTYKKETPKAWDEGDLNEIR